VLLYLDTGINNINKKKVKKMKKQKYYLSNTRVGRLRAQGYLSENREELSRMAFGIRFPYRLCVAVLVIAIGTQSIALFSAMFLIAFSGVVLPNHPFDYIYNHLLSEPMNRPKVPPRANQLRFACTIATMWLGGVLYFMATGAMTTALVLAAILVAVALLPATIDLCIPSLIYNALFKVKTTKTA